MRARTIALPLLVLLTLLAAACGSTSSGSTSSGGSSSNTAAADGTAHGTPLVVGLMTDINGNPSQPWVLAGARIGAAAVNAAGGINGRPVRIDFCDDHSTGPGAAICAQKLLVQDKALMMVGDDGTQEPGLIPTLATANTISWGSGGASLQSLTSPRVYVVDPDEAEYWVLPQLLPKTTRHLLFLQTDTAIAGAAVKAAEAYVPKGIAVSTITVPQTATTFESYCTQIKDSGADTVSPLINVDAMAALVQQCQQVGVNVLWALGSQLLTPQLIQTITQYHLRNILALGLGGGGTLTQFEKDAAKYGPEVGGDTNLYAEPGINAWLAVVLLPRVIAGAHSLKPATIAAWLNRQTAFSTGGATAPIDFAATRISSVPRLKNFSATRATITDGTIKVTNPTPVVAKLP